MELESDISRVNLEVLLCPCCGCDDFFREEYLNWGWPSSEHFNDLDIQVCNSCGFGLALPEPSIGTLSDFYRNHYRSRDSVFFVDFRFEGNRVFVPPDPRSIAQISLGSQFCDLGEGDVFLDLGPGIGSSFSELNMMHPGCQLVAVEENFGAADSYKKRFGVRSYQSLGQLVRGRVQVKMALMSHSLEHFGGSALHELLGDLKGALQKGGVLVVEVPNEDLRQRGLGRMRSTPHLSFFSLPSLRQLFENQGWEVLFLRASGTRQHRTKQTTQIDLRVSRFERARRLIRPVLSKSKTLARLRMLSSSQGVLSRVRDNLRYGEDGDVLRLVARPRR